MKFVKFYGALLLSVLLLAACESPTTIDPSLLPGYWTLSGTQQHYHYLANGTGKFWDESEDVFESDVQTNGNGYFTWSLSGDQLILRFTIEINQGGVPKVYTITTLNSTQLIYKDDFKNSKVLTRH